MRWTREEVLLGKAARWKEKEAVRVRRVRVRSTKVRRSTGEFSLPFESSERNLETIEWKVFWRQKAPEEGSRFAAG